MRLSAAVAGLLLCSAVFQVSSPTRVLAENNVIKENLLTSVTPAIDDNKQKAYKPKASAKKKKNKIHIVKSGDSLSKVAKHYKTSWQRIYDKNKQVKDPDLLKVGEKIVIPFSGEKLKSRKVPQTPVANSANNTVQINQPVASQSSRYPKGSSTGNTYTYGYCTWYVKERRPDLPNNLGNADTWVARASAQGLPTGSKPRVGAAGQQGMHVVYVEKVFGDGTVLVSEMNFQGWNVVSKRRVAASNFMYIY